MNILLVDDDVDVIEGILCGVDFEAIGIDTVLTAQSAASAREILMAQDVDIMLTDIEMPGESGLNLLTWVRSAGYDIVTLFCTSYADFNYAKKAVEMHSFDYFLKPISYEALQERLAAAAAEADKQKNMQSYRKHSELWLLTQNEAKRHFWSNAALSSKTPQEIYRDARADELNYHENEQICLCCMFLYDQESETPAWKFYGFRNIAEEILANEGPAPEAMIPLTDGSWLAVYLENEGYSEPALYKQLQYLRSCVSKYLEAELNTYFLPGIRAVDIRRSYTRLLNVTRLDVTSRNAIIRADRYQSGAKPYESVHIKEWELLLLSGKGEQLLTEIESHLDSLSAKGRLDRPYLRAMQLDLLQMLYTLLNERGINAHTLFIGEEYDRLMAHSLESLTRFKHYLRGAFGRALQYMEFADTSQSVVGQVKEYIRIHLGEEINRGTVARQVYLNPDYLARIFKKETGKSIGAYLMEKRLHEAKKLLVQSSIHINEIAQRVGYDNFSYFSQIFKEKTGMTPGEYRKQNTGKA